MTNNERYKSGTTCAVAGTYVYAANEDGSTTDAPQGAARKVDLKVGDVFPHHRGRVVYWQRLT
jgi:hypothetical protein